MKPFIAELKRAYVIMKHYWLSTLTDLLVYIAGFLFVFMFVKGNYTADTAAASQALSQLVFGYLIWFFVSISLSYSANSLYTEMVTGAFEQVYMTGLRVSWLMFVRFLVNSIRFAVIILSLAAMISWLTDIPYQINGLTWLLFLLLEVGTLGIAYLLAGLTIRFKNTGQLAFVLSILLLGPSLMNMDMSSSAARILATFLPIVGTQSLIKQTLANNLLAVNLETIMPLMVNAVIYFIIGLVVFELCLEACRKRGILNRY